MALGATESNGVTTFTCELVAEFVEIPLESVDPDADLFARYAIESLQLVELMTAMERRFGVRMEFNDFRTARTANLVAACVLDRIQDLSDGG